MRHQPFRKSVNKIMSGLLLQHTLRTCNPADSQQVTRLGLTRECVCVPAVTGWSC